VFKSAGFLLVRPDPDRDPVVPRSCTCSLCGCLSDFLPDTWCISWAEDGKREQEEHCKRFELTAAEYSVLADFVTTGFDTSFGWTNVIYDLDAAVDFHERYGRSRGFRLVEIGLHESDIASFIDVAMPPAQKPGYAPNGEVGVLVKLRQGAAMSPLGRVIGFEPVSFFLAMGHSWYCTHLHQKLATEGVHANDHGLIQEYSVAKSICERLGNGALVGEPEPYFPWCVSLIAA
jgi:hypothetical protein